ncbi:MAG: hypothetical protein NTY31_03140 [Candidatus Falkowbacteria bacterium]|nr:hypothetical protein [Candidatus Falkowbacteria bacterium]
MTNTYKIKDKLLIIGDGRYSNEEIMALYREIENHIFRSEFNEDLNACLDDCLHKIKATWYHLSTIKQEVEEIMTHPKHYLQQQVFQSYPKIEFQDNRLIYEIEAFLFQVKSNLDIIVQVLTFFYPNLKSENADRPNGFDGKKRLAGYKTIEKLTTAGEARLADYFKGEVSDWIQEMVDLRNTVTHKTQLENYQSFLITEMLSNELEIKTPLMPSGQKVEVYCQLVFDKLLNFYRTVFVDIIGEYKK